MSKGKKKSTAHISSSGRAKSLRVQDAARLTHKNSRTMVKILQLLEASQLPDGSFHSNSFAVSDRIEKLKARVKRRLEVLARWGDRPSEERLQKEPRPTAQSLRQQANLSRSLLQYAPTSTSSRQPSLASAAMLSRPVTHPAASTAGPNLSNMDMISHQRLFEMKRAAVDRFGTAVAQQIMGEESDLNDVDGTSPRTDTMRSLYTDIDDNYKMSNEGAIEAYDELRTIVDENNCQGDLPRDKINMYNGLIHKLTGRKSSANALKLSTLESKLDSIEMQEKIWALKNGRGLDSLELSEDNPDLVELRKQLEKGDRQQFIFSNTRVNWGGGDTNETYKMADERALEVFNDLMQIVLSSDPSSCLPREKLYIYNALLHKLLGKRSCANNIKISTLHVRLTCAEVQEAIAAIQASL